MSQKARRKCQTHQSLWVQTTIESNCRLKLSWLLAQKYNPPRGFLQPVNIS